MALQDISLLKGATFLLNRNPHLVEAQVDETFDKLIQNSDGSFAIRPRGKSFYINIEDGRQSVHPTNGKPYCKKGETDCVSWRGDLEADPYFVPGPHKDKGSVHYVEHHHLIRKPSLLVWAILAFIIYQILD